MCVLFARSLTDGHGWGVEPWYGPMEGSVAFRRCVALSAGVDVRRRCGGALTLIPTFVRSGDRGR